MEEGKKPTPPARYMSMLMEKKKPGKTGLQIMG
jgi:hypothetical protein